MSFLRFFTIVSMIQNTDGFIMEKHITLSLGGIPLRYTIHYPTLLPGFEPFQAEEQQAAAQIVLTGAEREAARIIYSEESADDYIEYMELCPRTSDALLPYQRCIFHGTAFLWQGKAWIFTAPSGTGKTTQYVLWKLIYGGELEILNGDKPLLDFSAPDGMVWVRPSPWIGKEGMRQMKSAPLGGVIYLRQGEQNTMRRLPVKEAVRLLYEQFIYTAAGEEQARQVCALEEHLLTRVPIWELINRGDRDSARLCHDTILHYLEQEGML